MFLTEFQTYKYTFEEVAPSVEEICSFLKLDPSEVEHPGMLFIESILPELHTNKEITGGYRIFPVKELNVKEGRLIVSGVDLHPDRQVCGYLKGSELVGLFVCTAGGLFTDLTHHFNSRGDLLEAYIVDAIGSLTVENAMDKIQQELMLDVSSEQKGISNRYSPGYCNWHLLSQKALFNLIDENPCGVSLTDSCLMQPIKSVSGIIGIGRDMRRKEYGCAICRNENCIYRKLQCKEAI